MKAFCVECGREGPVYEGLCAECLATKRSLVELPPVTEVVQCAHCQRYHLPGGWREAALDEALTAVLERAARVVRDARHHRLRATATEREGKLAVRVEARIDLPEMTVVQETQVEARVRTTTCPRCSRQRGDYYEAILQLRADGRGVRPQELQEARALVAKRVAADAELFVTREEEVHQGWDVYLSSSRATKSLAHALRGRLGGHVSASPRLHTRKGGRDIHRTTYLLRLPGPSVGDVVRLEGKPALILTAGRSPTLWELSSGEVRRVEARALARAEPLDARVVPGQVVSRGEATWQVMDTRDYHVHEVPSPLRLEEGDEVRLVLIGDAAYAAPRT